METACRHVTKAGAVFRQPLPAGVAQVVCCTLMAKAAPSMAADRSNRHHSQSVMQPNTSPLPLCALQHHTTVGRCTPETWVRMLPPPQKNPATHLMQVAAVLRQQQLCKLHAQPWRQLPQPGRQPQAQQQPAGRRQTRMPPYKNPAKVCAGQRLFPHVAGMQRDGSTHDSCVTTVNQSNKRPTLGAAGWLAERVQPCSSCAASSTRHS